MSETNHSAPVSAETTAAAPPADTRRNFLVRALAGLIGAVVSLVPFITGVIFFCDPLLRRKKAAGSEEGSRKDAEGFLRMGLSVDDLPADGTPQLFKVHDDVVDAWNKFLNVEIGSVWLRRNPGGRPEVLAFSSICPHLGCAVDFRASARDFYCPCHTSAFRLDGTKKNDIPPRNLDRLEVKVGKDGTLWIRYVEYRSGTPEQIPVS